MEAKRSTDREILQEPLLEGHQSNLDWAKDNCWPTIGRISHALREFHPVIRSIVLAFPVAIKRGADLVDDIAITCA